METGHKLIGNSGVFIFNVNRKPENGLQRFRLLFKQGTDTKIEIIYNSERGMVINDHELELTLKNSSRLYLIVEEGHTLYISTSSPSFADIIFSLNLTEPFGA